MLEMNTTRGRHQGKAPSMMELVIARRGFGVIDPRDIIWAHVGLASDGKHH